MQAFYGFYMVNGGLKETTMKRRPFIGAGMGAAALMTGAVNCDNKEPKTPRNAQTESDDLKLAGLSLEELRLNYRNYLFDEFLPFVEKYVIYYLLLRTIRKPVK